MLVDLQPDRLGRRSASRVVGAGAEPIVQAVDAPRHAARRPSDDDLAGGARSWRNRRPRACIRRPRRADAQPGGADGGFARSARWCWRAGLAACATTRRWRGRAPSWRTSPTPPPTALSRRADALVGATVYDGAGGRIESGTVLLAEGKVQVDDRRARARGPRRLHARSTAAASSSPPA